jgi:UDP-N-acetylglucosamine acyltransferase
MADPAPFRIHPRAIIAPEAVLHPDARVGAFCVIEGAVHVGPGCIIRRGASLIGPLRLGRDNRIASGAVLGEKPQHLKHDQVGGLEIGDGNIFGPGVTIHQGTAAPTIIGNGCHFHNGCHVGHDCRLGDGCIIGGNALLGGHCIVGACVRLGPHVGVHQFCRLGRLARLRASATTTKDVPPFILQQGRNVVTGINVAGLRRAGVSAAEILALRRLYKIVYLRGLALPSALLEVERELGLAGALGEFVAFARSRGRGINDNRPSQ